MGRFANEQDLEMAATRRMRRTSCVLASARFERQLHAIGGAGWGVVRGGSIVVDSVVRLDQVAAFVVANEVPTQNAKRVHELTETPIPPYPPQGSKSFVRSST